MPIKKQSSAETRSSCCGLRRSRRARFARCIACDERRRVMIPHLAEDLAVTLADDRPGMLAKAIGCISAGGINIDGDTEVNGGVHVVTAALGEARQCLTNAGFREVQEQDVVVVPVSDEPGAAARVFQRIAEARINVRYSYLATGNRLVIASSNPQAVLTALGS